MDVKQFRDTAELSDFTVYIDNERFKLHKFPLYTKSDYFREIANNNPVCQISDFPGGSKSFATVADFCYGKEINISSENVIYLYAAADYLKMKGKDNLFEISKRHLDDIFRSVVQGKGVLNMICVLCSAFNLKSEAVKKICEDATELLVSVWLHEGSIFKSFFSSHNMNYSSFEQKECSNESVSDYLIYLPLGTFLKVIDIARNKDAVETIILDPCAKYLGRILDYYDPKSSEKKESKILDPQNGTDAKNILSKVSCMDKNVSDNSFCGLNIRIKYEHLMQLEKIYSDNINLLENLKNTTDHFEKIFEVLHQPIDICGFINNTWIIKALLLVDSNRVKSKCRLDVLKIANRMLINFSEQDFDKLSPPMLNDILNANNLHTDRQSADNVSLSRRSSKRRSYAEGILENSTAEIPGNRKRSSIKEESIEGVSESNEDKSETKLEMLPESVASHIIKYLLKKADEQKLTMQEYIQFLKKVGVSNSQDSLDNDFVKILINLTKSGRSPSEEDTREIMNHINLNNCTANTLNDALKMDLFPPKTVAEAALHVANKNQDNQISISSNPECYLEYPYAWLPSYYTKPLMLPMRGKPRYDDIIYSDSHYPRTFCFTRNKPRSSSLNRSVTSEWKHRGFNPHISSCQPYSNESRYNLNASSTKFSDSFNNSYLSKSMIKNNAYTGFNKHFYGYST
ncbi:BTB/POZ domain-containing protein [Schistosoma japonicum]|nr:BTB/POZ domain-containing protein [Schistosoma japonicum]